ncbi:transporter substrate-binding domain-containing protein [Nonomuraea sp. NPDC049141]|uniref:transporter substrate-binding domain-containing protein n=1 Tax=Nonomuraea sp. NPDC049141 TaxID=3155500 RepID=UPI00340FC6F3
MDDGRIVAKYEIVFNNVTVTEERKDTYDFATYRIDQLGWQVPDKSPIKKIAKPADIAGLRVSVGSGTNQEKILLDWDKQNKAAGLKPVEILYYEKYGDVLLGLKSGRVQAYFGPNPSIAYNIAVSGGSRIVGTFSGAGPDLQGLIAAMTKKGNGLEYTSRYGSNDELARYPEAEFAPPHGAFRRYDAATAELKRVWTRPHHRGAGLGRLVVRELERGGLRQEPNSMYIQ